MGFALYHAPMLNPLYVHVYLFIFIRPELSAELIELQWMTFPERVHFQKVIQAYKIMNNTCPQYLQNCFTFTNGIHCKSARSAVKFSVHLVLKYFVKKDSLTLGCYLKFFTP